MRLILMFAGMVGSFILTSCASKGTNPIDPFEPFNRKVHNFNMAFDATVLRPPAKLYKAVVPRVVRKGVNNAFNNLDLFPTIASDILQAEGKWVIRDSWRLFINSTIGVGGLFDVAEKFGLPPHYNDLGLTLAKWGDKKSPYLVIPFLGPSTLRDGAGWLFQFALWSPYVYIDDAGLVYGLIGLRYIDLRTQLFDTEPLLNEALDKYTFIRDAYLQHRNYLIAGTEQDTGSSFVEDTKANKTAMQESTASNNQLGSDYVDE
ncbi:TPA: MlaA family lipoprotein [Legionella pneumophila]|uniref:MlaA family lipoprotein n=1 Tax=Legionella pneumophila TaxID=446 RepID=UPI0007868BC7|nr:VacJ family lipoprotein [Legionella pneumophila]HAU1190556.1 VacJ family lipoprotein [Legionella pneumophila]HBD7101120.1 VacJ family lipoprotein [Legionella pneumophila]HCO4737347.1 VacJ family lipoprotein [Legionella pneumophila]HDU7928242.1 VacJ family lipoprotein [Legionella pneumophila]HDU7934373.1 VacJ family lipoprotein [Legionella pneumophila]